MPPRLSPAQLNAFLAAAELGNFSHAARRLNLTPSAISSQIGELEASLGFDLFERTTRKVVLTVEGREFLPTAIAAQRAILRAGLAAADIRQRRREIVRVAAPLSVAASLLPKLIAEFRRDRPDAHVRIVDTGVEWLSDRVAAGEVDMAVGPDRTPGPEVTALALFPSPWVAWCARTHPMAACDPLTWEDALAWDFYAAGRDHDHSVRPQLAGLAGERLEPLHIVDNISTALGLAAAGLGFTCSPAYLEDLATPMGLVMRPLHDPLILRYMTLFTARERPLSPTAASFSAFLQDWAGHQT